MISKQRLFERLQNYLRIDSPSFREGKLASVVANELQSIGLDPFDDRCGASFGGDSGNLFVKLSASEGCEGEPGVLLNAHLDTVSTAVGAKVLIEGDIITTDGKTALGADDKAGVAIAVELLASVLEEKAPHPLIEVLFTVCEEAGLLGARRFDIACSNASYGIVLDGDGQVGRATVAGPSYNSLRLKVIGRSAHAGVSPEDGINAISIAARAIAGCRLGRIDEVTTANIGVIKGGAARNIVPELCEVEGEVRSHSETKLDEVTKSIVANFKEACAEAGAMLEEMVVREFNSFSLSEDDLPVRVFLRACRLLGLRPQLEVSCGGSDANILNEKGLPSITVAVGISNPHSFSESLSLSAFFEAARLVEAMVLETKEN